MIKFTIEQHDDCWSFTTDQHGQHKGYPDALQATSAAMRAFDPSLERTDIPANEARVWLDREGGAVLHGQRVSPSPHYSFLKVVEDDQD